MDRLNRFATNAGVQGCLLTGVVAVGLLVALIKDFGVGHWVFTLPLLLAAFGLTYAIRGFLVDNFSIMRGVMNTVAIAGIVAAAMLPKVAGPEPLWWSALLVGVMGTYMGCYFWMLSDDQIAPI